MPSKLLLKVTAWYISLPKTNTIYRFYKMKVSDIFLTCHEKNQIGQAEFYSIDVLCVNDRVS